MVLTLGGCSDRQPLISTPDTPDYFYGWDHGASENEFWLHFDPLWGPMGHFWGTGVQFVDRKSGGGIGIAQADAFDTYFIDTAPPTSGSSAIPMLRYPEFDMLFDFPVKDISFNVRVPHDFQVTCFDEAGAVVGGRQLRGSWWSGGVQLYPYGSEPIPIPVQHVALEGKGIRKCSITTWWGGMLDDLRYHRDRNELILTCTGDLGENRVTRGAELSCEASGSSDDDEIEIENWSFTGVDSRGQPYTYPDTIDGPATDNPWRGKMAIGGTVSVRATINGGEPQEKSAPVTVEARNWTTAAVESTVRRAEYAEFLGHPNLPPSYPGDEHHLGTTFYGGEYPSPQEPGILEFINDFGPNHYLTFLARVPVELDIAVIVHPEMTRGSAFYRRQPVDARDVAQGAPCVQVRFDRYVELILAHEGYPSATPQSHTGVFLREYRQRAGARVEGLVVPNDQLGPLAELYREKLDAVQNEADAVSDSEVDGQFGVRFECEFNFTLR